MPILKNALKKQRVDKHRTGANVPVRTKMKSAVKAARQEPTAEKVAVMQSALDRAVKRGIIKKNRAARVKSRVSTAAKAKSKASN